MNKRIDVPQDALLISRTDPRGYILSANDAFVDLSGYSEAELIGAPHKIVRHPDMPKGLFYLLWQELLQGNPVGAYVVNLSKDGRPYWVFATLSPLSNGHISMRIKASDVGIETSERYYAIIRAREREEDLSPQASAAALVELLRADGHHSYHTYMAGCLGRELAAREDGQERPSDPAHEHLRVAVGNWHDVGTHCEEIFKTYRGFGTTPLNMQVQAGHLEGAGAALSKIASNFAGIATEINADLERYMSSVTEVEQALHDYMFQTYAQALMSEARRSVLESSDAPQSDRQIIEDQQRIYCERAAHGLRTMLARLSAFMHGSEGIKRQLSGLSVTRVMCAIEVAQIGGDSRGNITAIVDDLRRFEDQTDVSMSKIEGQLRNMGTELRSIERLQARGRPTQKMSLAT